MDESEENISTEDFRGVDSPFSVKSKPKKRSLVERELETNLTARVTSPVTGEGTSTSRYGRACRLKTENELESEKLMKPLRIDTKSQPQAYKMHASNSPIRKESPKRAVSVASSIENQIENIYNENMSLSRFGSTDDSKPQSPAKKFTKVYIRKDLIQKPDTDTVVLIKNMFSPVNKSSHLNNILERSSEKYSLNGHGRPRNGFPDTSSVVKTLDFDGKKKKETKEKMVAKNELFVLEAGCDYQVGDLAWARVGTYPFWPCIVTREPFTDMFVKKKMFGRVEHDVIHVTFFGDNGRRGWIVDNMLRKFHGRPEFEGARAKFTPEMKKKDPRLYAAHFVSEKKLPLWNISVDEAETLMREPKRLRIDILYEMLENARAAKTTPKRERSGKITRTDSDVSLSESLYDTLFSEDDAKADDSKRTKKPRNKSLDVSEVVTACLDNMAAKTGIIKIQKQSHMDRWLQKAKSKTPEKTQPKILVKVEKEKKKDKTKKKQKDTRKSKKNESLSSEKTLLPYQNEHDYSSVNYENHDINDSSNINTDFEESGYDDVVDSSNIEVTAKVESLSNNMEDCSQEDIITTIVSDDIVMNDLENTTKVDNCELVNDCPEMITESVPDSNVTNVENKASSNETKESVPDSNETNVENKTSLKETEQIESKVELPENDVLLNIGLQPRRSKRKRQSDVEKKKSSIVKNETEESKLESVQAMARIDDELTVSDRNIVNSNSDHRENVLDRDKKDSTEQNIDTVIKEDDPVVSEVDKDTTKHNKEHNHSAMLPLKAPRPAVFTEKDTIIKEDDTVVSEVDKDTTKYNKEHNYSAMLPLNAPRAVVVIEKDTIIKEDDPVVSEVDKDTTKHYKEQNHSAILPLKAARPAVFIEKDTIIKEDDPVVSEVGKDTTKHNKEHNHSAMLPLNALRAVVVIEKDTIIKDDPVVSEVDTDMTKHNKEHNHSAMLPMNAPRPVVVIEPLKMEGFESLTIVNAEKLKKESGLCKLNEDVIISNDTTTEKSSDKDNIEKNSDSSVVNNVDSYFSETNTNSSSPADEPVSEKVQEVNSTINSFSKADKLVTKKASAKNEIAITEHINKVINQDKILSVPVNKLNDDNRRGDAANDANAKDMDVDETSLHHSNETNYMEKVEFGSTCSEDSDLPLSNFQTNLDQPPKTNADSLFSNQEKSQMNEKLNVVIGEEMYIFDRTLSQDYDEIKPDISKITNDLVTASNNDEAIKSDINCEINNVSKCERTLSPVYDDIDMEKDENAIEKCDEKSENKIASNDQVEPAPEINTETVTNGVETDSQVFYKASVHKSKEKVHTQSQLKSIKKVMLNGDDKIVSDEILDNTNKIETLNDDQISEPKTKKRSPKLSLKKVKDQKSNEINEVKSVDTISTKSIFLDNNSNKDKIVTNKDLKDNKEPCDVVCNGLDFEMLIDMERTKQHAPKINGFVENIVNSSDIKPKDEVDADTVSMKSEDSGVSITRRKIRSKEKQDLKKGTDDLDFLKYLEIRQDALIDEQPELSHDEIVTYLYQTWLYEESNKSDRKKTDDAEQSNLVKGLNQDPPPPKKIKKKPKVEKETNVDIRDLTSKDKPKRKATQSKPYYNEEFSDLEEEDLETFSIFDKDVVPQNEDGEEIDEVELYFEKLTKPKPNVFKGYVREKVCEICEKTGNLVKCKSCHGSFHVDCVKKEDQVVEVPPPSTRGRRKKKKPKGRKPKGYDESLLDSESQSDEKSQDANLSEEFNMSMEDDESHITVDAANFEAQLELKMKELQVEQTDDFESDQEISWDAPPGQCEIIDVKHKEKQIDYSDYKCYNCEKYETPVCFVCRSNKSPKTLTEARQKCQVAHCHRYYHMECLEYWPQTQFNSWEPSKTNKKVIEYIEALSCPRHVCHTCVSDDPRGCKTRFCGDKLARCVKCPATYHAFTKCLPAGTQILTGSQIICPRHYEHRVGKVPCHVNTGWCFICALGGTLICCEYCPTSFHAECLNIKPPEGSYMCEDCETGRLPLYGEMVWVKLGHYRWWPGIVLHPTEIPENIMAVKHSPGEFVVRFFGQYDHYWVNRGRVFPFQEGDSGKISSQKSKIDVAFTTAMEHVQRACEILKNVEPNEEEDMDIASSLLPPHYVKLKANKPVGSLTARRDVDANSLTQCDCDPKQADPCGPYSHCLNRMLLTECGPLCRAGDNCNNRAFERRDYPRLAAYRTPQRGWGLKTLEDIRQGQFVIEYVGELIDEEEFRRRMRRKHEIRDENFYFLTLDKERMIDAGPKGNLARFMNHCCEPNCETQKWTVLGDVRVGLFALRDIPANSEVTFNYNLECAGIEKKRCLCGAKRCSGYIGAKPKQEEAQPKKIKVPGKRTYKKRKHLEESPSTSKIKPPIKIKIKPIKPRELTEIEKDLLIIKNATNGMSSDSDSRVSSVDEKKDTRALKRKRVCFSTDESGSNGKKLKRDDSED